MLADLLSMIFHGILIGVVVSAPMGPVGIFCIQRTLDRGHRSGFYTGMGAAISDLIYCLLTGFCLSFIEDFINMHRAPIQLFGASVLIGFGIWLIRKKPDKRVEVDSEASAPSPKADILKGFALTFSNPLILFLIIGLFAQFNFVIEGMKFYHYILGFIGIFAGALGWWWTVTYFVDKVRGHFTQHTMKLINTIVGIIILIFAAVGIFSSVKAFAAHPVRNPVLEGAITGSAEFRVEDRAMKGWSADIADSHGEGFLLRVRPVSESDAFGDSSREMLEVEALDRSSLAILASAVISDGIDPFRGRNAWKIACSDAQWSVFAGNREYRHVFSFPCRAVDVPDLPVVAASSGGAIEVSGLSGDFSSSRGATPMRPDLADFIEGAQWRKPGLAGIYSLFDFEHDDSFATIGGDYRLAAMPDYSGGDSFDLVYLSGARQLSGCWLPGMVKARLLATPFHNVYDVHWADVRGEVMAHDIHADFDPLTQILTVRFPYQNAALRFRKESPAP